MMNDPFVHMHGPENHVLAGAALLAAYRNAGGDVDIDTAFAELSIERAVRFCRERLNVSNG